MANDLSTSLRDLLVDILTPLDEAARDPQALAEWLASFGYTSAVSQQPALLDAARHAQALIGKLQAFDAQNLASTDGLVALLSAGREAAAILQELRAFAADPARSAFAAGLGEELMAALLAGYLRRRHPKAFRIASLLKLIDAKETAAMDPPVTAGSSTLRRARVIDRFRFSTFNDLVSNPGATLQSIYFPNGLAQGADAWSAADRLFPSLSLLADELGLASGTDYRSNTTIELPELDPNAPIQPESPRPDPDDPETPDVVDDSGGVVPVDFGPMPDEYFATNDPALRLGLVDGAGDSGLALQIRASSSKHPSGIAGLVLSVLGDFDRSETRGPWTLSFSSSGALPALALGPNGLARVPADSAFASGHAKLVAQRSADAGAAGPAFRLGSAQGTRLEIGTLNLAGDLAYDAQGWSLSLGVDADKGTLVLVPADGDSFLASLLPADGLRADFDLGLAWSSKTGLALRGSAGLDASVPIGRSIGGVSLTSVNLGLHAAADKLGVEVSASLAASIGPLKAVIDRIGIAGALSFAQGGGNLGVADLDIAFKPPSGVGVSVDAHGVLSGGGFLFHDSAKGLYAGVMQLSLHDQITLKAFGLIATRLPDGSRGYSLVVFITAEGFRPIPLGLGFTLLGIGGMVAVNRTFDQEVLRQGLKNGSLAALLFPRDPVGNAPALIQALAGAFPARRGSYMLGILAKLGWFTPTLVTLDLALILEFGARKRLLALGHISALLPSADNDLVRLNMDAMGVIDFDAGTAAIDAVLVDSRLARRFPITGSAALRAGFGSGPDSSFVLSVGGLNPHFVPPAGLPQLDRVAIALSSGDNPRLVCESYFAITANTLQFGARASLWASAAGFSIDGDIGYDVLVQLAPLHFIADFHARLQLKRGSHNLLMVELEGELEGPRPLRLSGKARFKILWFHYAVKFDATLVRGDPPPLPPAVDVFAQLTQALAAPSSWTVQRSSGDAAHGVSLRSLPPAAATAPLVLDPLGRLAVKQQVVPLDTGRDIDTFGGAPVAGERRFSLSASFTTPGSDTPLASEPLPAAFAPAQYFTMSDDEKLAAPSFESMAAGCVFGSADTVIDGAKIVAAPVDYRTITIGTAAPASGFAAAAVEPAPAPYVLDAAQLPAFGRSGAAARAPLRRVGRARFRNAGVQPGASVGPDRWAIVSRADGASASLEPSVRTWSEYQAALKTLNRAAANWQLVPAHELEA